MLRRIIQLAQQSEALLPTLNLMEYSLKLKKDLEGIHKSELSWKPNNMFPSDFNEGQELEAKVIVFQKRIAYFVKS